MMNPLYSLASDKISPEEIVAKHLESIGASETRASIKSRIASGTVAVSFQAPRPANFTGRTIMASEENKNFVGLTFENSGYTQEKFASDGQNVTIGYIVPGERSNLGDFLLTYKDIVKSGLLGGTLSSAWPLLNLPAQKVKLESGGTKKIDGKPAVELKYVLRSGSDVQISMFFDQETFRHVRTEYTKVISAGIGSNINGSGGQRPTRYKLTEDFSNFQKEGGLMLPHTYKITLDLDTMAGTFAGNWQLTLNQFSFNQPIPATTFKVQ
jgi:hypothetical protein